jgi:hypothetical protein
LALGDQSGQLGDEAGVSGDVHARGVWDVEHILDQDELLLANTLASALDRQDLVKELGVLHESLLALVIISNQVGHCPQRYLQVVI